ncbi:MAG: sigma-70 family RNA polymerase sigma factor [Verrucomicrobiales bacterium]
MDEISQIFEALEAGKTEAAEELLPLAYDELHRIAAQKMASERAGHTLQPTALAHEAYLRLLGPDGAEKHWDSKGHFFSAAARAMRQILIESARRKKSQKRGGGAEHTAWSDSMLEFSVPTEEVLAVDEALQTLEKEDPALAQVVLLRYFAGMTVPETAAALGVGTSTVDRQWKCAKAWLHQEMKRET